MSGGNVIEQLDRQIRRERANGVTLAEERGQARDLRKPPAPPPAVDTDPEKKARRRLAKMLSARRQHGDRCHYSEADIATQRERVALFADRSKRAPATTAFDANPIVYLPRTVALTAGLDPDDVAAMRAKARTALSCRVVGYDSRLGCPDWITDALQATAPNSVAA